MKLFSTFITPFEKYDAFMKIGSILKSQTLKDINDVQYASTSNSHYSAGKNCVKFYSSKNDYKSFDALYDLIESLDPECFGFIVNFFFEESHLIEKLCISKD